MFTFDFKKTVQALNFFAIQEGGSLNKMKALKLIWLSDRLHLRKYARLISGDQYYALKNGPVPSGTRDILQKNNFLMDVASDYATEYLGFSGNYVFKSIHQPNMMVFSDSDLECMNIIYQAFGKFDHFELSEFSHSFPEWKKYETLFNNPVISSRAEMNIFDFFLNVQEKSGLFVEEEEVLSFSKTLYQESLEIKALF